MSGNRIMDGITEGQKDRTTEGQGESSIAPLFQSGAIKNTKTLNCMVSLVRP